MNPDSSILVQDLRVTARRLSALLDEMDEERRHLLIAVSDLLEFQQAAVQLVSDHVDSEHGRRRASILIEQFRRPTIAVSKVREAALAFSTQPRQRDLPLPPFVSAAR